MIGELDIHGVYVSSLLVWATLAYLLFLPVRRVLAAVGLLRHVAHRALFEAALFVVLLGGVWRAAQLLGS